MELTHVELDALVVEIVKPGEGGIARQAADRRAVLGRDVVEEVRRPQSFGAGHVLHDDRGRAGNMTAHVPGEQARVLVVAAAHRSRGDQIDALAAIELGNGLRICVRSCCERDAGRHGRPYAATRSHHAGGAMLMMGGPHGGLTRRD